MQTFLPVFVKVGNDANMAALGEFWKGSAKGYQSVMLVTVGTGVGVNTQMARRSLSSDYITKCRPSFSFHF